MNPTSNRGCLWQLSHSTWVLWSLFLMPCVGFFIIGRRVNHRPWVVWGFVYLACMAIMFTLIDSKYKDNSIFETFMLLYTIGSIVHTFVARGEYIRRLEALEDELAEFYQQRQQAPTADRTQQFAQQYQTRHSQYAEDNQRSQEQQPARQATQSRQAPPPPSEVDVNSCTAQEMSRLPGIGIVAAKQAIAYRNEHGGFTSFDEFAKVLNLKPHIIVQLQDRVVCRPMKRQDSQPPTTGGDAPTHEHHGRRLDL